MRDTPTSSSMAFWGHAQYLCVADSSSRLQLLHKPEPPVKTATLVAGQDPAATRGLAYGGEVHSFLQSLSVPVRGGFLPGAIRNCRGDMLSQHILGEVGQL